MKAWTHKDCTLKYVQDPQNGAMYLTWTHSMYKNIQRAIGEYGLENVDKLNIEIDWGHDMTNEERKSYNTAKREAESER